MSGKLERKHLDKPDETRTFKDGKGTLSVATLGDHTFARGVFEPGWRWSQHVSRSPERHLANPRTPAASWKGTCW